MVEKLSVEIALEGSKQVERELASLGKAGEKAFEAISEAAKEAGSFEKVDPKELTNKFQQLGITGAEAFNRIKAAAEQSANTQRIAASVAELEQKLKAAGTAGVEAFNKIRTAADQTNVQRFLAVIGEVDAKLAAMGESGKKAFSEIGNAANQTTGAGARVADEAEKGGIGLESLAAGAILLGKNLSQMGTSALAALRAMGPLGIAAAAGATAAGALVLQVVKAEEELAKLSQVAAGVNLSVEKYNALKNILEAIGISGEAAAAGIGKIQSAIDKVSLDKVNAAFNQLQENAKRGFGVQGTAELRALEEAAKGSGEAAKLAREKLQALGQPVPDAGIAGQLRSIIEGSKSVEEAIPKLIEKLKTIPDSVERTRAASEVLGPKLAAELLRAVEPATAVEAALNRLKKAWDELIGLEPIKPSDETTVQFFDRSTERLQALRRDLEATKTDLDNLDNFMLELFNNINFDNLKRGFGQAVEDMKSLWNRFKKEFGGTAGAAELPGGREEPLGGEKGADLAAAISQSVTELGKLTTNFNQFNTKLAEFAELDVAGIDQFRNNLTQFSSSLGELATAFSTGGESLDQFNTDITPVLSALTASGGSLDQFNTGITTISEALAVIAESLDQFNVDITTVSEALVTSTDGLNQFNTNITTVSEALVTSTDGLNQLVATLNAFNAALSSAGRIAPASAPANARGGLLGGRGTGTSDSNLAWVSRGEYIIPARAVRQPGVLAFLEALRRSGGNLLRGYAGGGIVGYADGGPVGPAFTIIGGPVKDFTQAVGVFTRSNQAWLGGQQGLLRDQQTAQREMAQTFRRGGEVIGAARFAGEQAFNKAGLEQIKEFFKELLPFFDIIALPAIDISAGNVLGAWEDYFDKINELLRGSPFPGGGVPFSGGGGQIVWGGGGAPGRMAAADTGATAVAALDTFGTTVGSVTNALASTTEPLAGLGTGSTQLASNVTETSTAFSRSSDGLDTLFGGLQEFNNNLRQFASLDRGGGSGTFAAGGGLLGGRGTGTSDSNLAWVSRGEYITPAKAVRQPGVLAFLEALRQSGGNLRRILDGMGRYALGGLVMPSAIPAMAAGGGMHPVTINFAGTTVSGLRASSDVVEELRRAAVMAQVRSGGRKPSRYG